MFTLSFFLLFPDPDQGGKFGTLVFESLDFDGFVCRLIPARESSGPESEEFEGSIEGSKGKDTLKVEFRLWLDGTLPLEFSR